MKFVSYNDKSSAKRGLARKNKDLQPEDYLDQQDGKWGFNLDDDGNPHARMGTISRGLDDLPPGEHSVKVDESGNLSDVRVSSPFPAHWPMTPAADAELDQALHAHHEDGTDVDPEAHAAESNSAFGSFALSQLGAQRPAPEPGSEPSGRSTLTKIERNRPEQNGVKRPSAGTFCAQVWDIATALSNGDEMPRTKIAKLSEVIKAAEAKGINKFTARTQYARWRAFHGLVGRVNS